MERGAQVIEHRSLEALRCYAARMFAEKGNRTYLRLNLVSTCSAEGGRRSSATSASRSYRVSSDRSALPKPEHREEMVRRLRRANEVVLTTPGCLGSEVWLSDDAVVTIGTWESKAQSQ